MRGEKEEGGEAEVARWVGYGDEGEEEEETVLLLLLTELLRSSYHELCSIFPLLRYYSAFNQLASCGSHQGNLTYWELG